MFVLEGVYPTGSMYGIFTYIYHKIQPNVGEYIIHGFYGDTCAKCAWFEIISIICLKSMIHKP